MNPQRPFKGLTWDHPRGYQALEAAARNPGAPINWSRQSLAGFEEAPIGALCEKYDLVVLDHPHLGEALAQDALQPLDTLFSAEELTGWKVQSVGPCFDSYTLDGRQWALPLDAATQVLAYRDGIRGRLPQEWSDVLEFARETRSVALSLQGPHALLTALSITTSMGFDWEGGELVNPDAEAGFETLRELYSLRPEGSETLNPIELLEAIEAGNDILLCPLIFGYVNYAQNGGKVRFTNAPLWRGSDRHGSIVGGTGLALTQRCRADDALLDHIRWLMLQECQNGFIPSEAGQPSAISAWQNPHVNAAASDFYRATFATMQDAALRPRFDGYIALQAEAAAKLREGLSSGKSAKSLIAEINLLYRKSTALAAKNQCRAKYVRRRGTT